MGGVPRLVPADRGQRILLRRRILDSGEQGCDQTMVRSDLSQQTGGAR
jgi:hypothetical protein